jgi:hypothetical protein
MGAHPAVPRERPRATRASAASTSVGNVGIDFNGDGYGDVAVSAGLEDLDAIEDAGGVNVMYGSPAGLSTEGSQFWSQDSPGLLDRAEKDDEFGRSSTSGDFDGDGFSDLAVGVPYEGTGRLREVGAVNVMYGSPTGLTSDGNQLWTQNDPGILDQSENGDHWGLPIGAGDFNGDGFDDLTVTGQNEEIGSFASAGAVNVIYGSAAGLTADGNQFWTQDSPGMKGDGVELQDFFGTGLGSGDFNRDGIEDLAVGAVREDLGSILDAGAVHVILGSTAGLTAVGNQLWTQDSPGVFDSAEQYDEFGRHLGSADLNGDSYDDLAVSVSREDVDQVVDAGAVNILYGSPTGLSGFGNQFWTQDSPGILDAAEESDQFGRFPLGTGDMNGDGYDDLGIGVMFEGLEPISGAGAVNMLYGSPVGLTDIGNQLWTQDSPGILDRVEPEDLLGRVFWGGDLNRDGFMDLPVGVGSEGIGEAGNAGGLAVIYGSTAGLSDAGNQFWTQDSPGMAGDGAEASDYFGRWGVDG